MLTASQLVLSFLATSLAPRRVKSTWIWIHTAHSLPQHHPCLKTLLLTNNSPSSGLQARPESHSRDSHGNKLGKLAKSYRLASRTCHCVMSALRAALQVHTTPRQSRSFSSFKSELLAAILDIVDRNGAEMPYPTSSVAPPKPKPQAA